MTDEQNPTVEPATPPQDAPDNVVSMSAHVLARSGLQNGPKPPQPVQDPALAPQDGPDANDAQPTRPTLRALTPPEVAALVTACTRSGSQRTRRNSAHTLGKQVGDLQNALLNFRAHVQRAMANAVTVQDAALAVLRVLTEDSAKDMPRTPGELRIQLEVQKHLNAMGQEVVKPSADETPEEAEARAGREAAQAEEPQS